MFIYNYIYCDRTHEWRATSPRAHVFRNPEKRCLQLDFLTKLGARHERACHSYAEFMLATECGLYWKSQAAAVARQSTELAEGSVRGREIKGGERGCKWIA